MPLIYVAEIVLEKMLHLFLAGNLLTALGGSLDFYQDGHIPKYPGHILKDNLEMDLSAADKEQLTLLKRARYVELFQHRCLIVAIDRAPSSLFKWHRKVLR